MKIPEDIATALKPLLDALPLDEAMGDLVVRHGPTPEMAVIVETVIAQPVIANRGPLRAALWLYVDALERSHRESQALDDSTGSYWHGIMHRREGDFGNSHYWFARAGHHPAMDALDDYDARAFIDDVSRAAGDNPADLVDLQRREWTNLFEWCCVHG